jgi:prephenate dehydrogenase
VRRLGQVRESLVARDGGAVAAWNDGARDERRRLLEADLAGGDVHELRVAVPNRPGVVAEIALALGRAGVNILDMALYPASDMSSGTVALWVAGTARAGEAEALLEGLGHRVARP